MANKKFFEPTPEMNELLVRAGSLHREESLSATAELAKALELPLRKGVMSGNILDGIFEAIRLESGSTSEFPLDFLADPLFYRNKKHCSKEVVKIIFLVLSIDLIISNGLSFSYDGLIRKISQGDVNFKFCIFSNNILFVQISLKLSISLLFK